jgi:sugar diacid utilization regulator
LEEMGLLLFTFAADLLGALEDGHVAQTRHLGRQSPNSPQAILTELLLGSSTPLDELLTRAAGKSLDVKGSYGLLLIFGQAAETEMTRISDAATQAHGAMISSLTVPVLYGPVPHVALVAPTPTRRNWEATVERVSKVLRDSSTGVLAVEPCGGLEKLVDVYRWSRQILRVARAVRVGEGALWDRDLAAYRLLQDSGEVERGKFVELVLGPILRLPRAKRDPLLATAEAIELQGQRFHDAAERLHVHEKTLRYRLNRIEELTGLDLQSTRDRFKLQLALYLLRLTP